MFFQGSFITGPKKLRGIGNDRPYHSLAGAFLDTPLAFDGVELNVHW
jgi:hypothetical protein